MPARRLTFTRENIRSVWEAVGIIPFNPRRAIGGLKRKEVKVTQEKGLAGAETLKIPKTPRAVSRITSTAASLLPKTTPSSLKLKQRLLNLSRGFQQTIADKTLEEEAHRQYRKLVGKEKKQKDLRPTETNRSYSSNFRNVPDVGAGAGEGRCSQGSLNCKQPGTLTQNLLWYPNSSLG